MRALWTLLFAAPAMGCASLATETLADAFASGAGGSYAADDDPELVRAAAPSGLKMMESVLAAEPEHEGLLLALCKGYAQYAYAFVEEDLENAVENDPARAGFHRERARRMWMRAHGYCRRGLQVRYEGWQPDEAGLAMLSEDDVPLAHWAAATWAGAIAVSKDPALLADLDKVLALARRTVALDPAYEGGAPHGLLGTLLASMPGADLTEARAHLERSAALAGPARMLPVLALARLGLKIKDAGLVRKNVGTILAFDVDRAPASRLENVIAQRRARRLLAEAQDLFLDEAPAGAEEN